MGVFRFKKFDVINDRSAMKVNTDGVLLGASMTIKSSDKTLLDVGTGTGTIALMAAQRLSESSNEFKITAIDIDKISVEEASQNFNNSPWSDHLDSRDQSLDEFSSGLKNSVDGCDSAVGFDLIFSNPPYFDESLLAPEQRRCNARHTSTGLSYRELLEFAAAHLSENGRISMVLPSETEQALTRHARMHGLYLFRILRVRTVPRKNPSRIIAEFSRQRCQTPEDRILTIQDEGKYSEEYLSLTHEFYLFA